MTKESTARLSPELFLIKEPRCNKTQVRCWCQAGIWHSSTPTLLLAHGSHYLISFRLTDLDFGFGVGQVQGKKRTVIGEEE